MPPAVHVGRVEEIDALVERVVNDADRLLVGGIAVDARHRHQAEADPRYLQRAASQLAHIHACSSSKRKIGVRARFPKRNQGQTTIDTCGDKRMIAQRFRLHNAKSKRKTWSVPDYPGLQSKQVEVLSMLPLAHFEVEARELSFLDPAVVVDKGLAEAFAQDSVVFQKIQSFRQRARQKIRLRFVRRVGGRG